MPSKPSERRRLNSTGARSRWCGQGRIVRPAHRLAFARRLEHRLDLAAHVGPDKEGAEFLSDPHLAADDLEAFGVEIGAGEIAVSVPSLAIRKGIFRSGSRRNTVSLRSTAPLPKSIA